ARGPRARSAVHGEGAGRRAAAGRGHRPVRADGGGGARRAGRHVRGQPGGLRGRPGGAGHAAGRGAAGAGPEHRADGPRPARTADGRPSPGGRGARPGRDDGRGVRPARHGRTGSRAGPRGGRALPRGGSDRPGVRQLRQRGAAAAAAGDPRRPARRGPRRAVRGDPWCVRRCGVSAAAEVSRDPRTGGRTRGPAVTAADEVARLLARAARDAAPVAAAPPSVRAGWLEAVATALERDAEELTVLADAETALGPDRLRGEVGRAAAQARFYGRVASGGDWLGVRIDRADGVDLRRMNRPLGPVAVFGASNFPFAFGVVGHDTCSALAAGCPVLAKAHPAHPRLSARLAHTVAGALADAGAPEGAFALVHGFDAGLALVDAPEVTAVAFTGSQSGGTALVERAARRPVPVPVFAEMGTVNPAVLTPAAAADGAVLRAAASGFVASFTLGQGQF